MTDAGNIARALGLRQHGRTFTGNCPACGYRGAFSVREKDGKTLFHCAACGDQEAVIDALATLGLWKRRHEALAGLATLAGRSRQNQRSATVWINARWREAAYCSDLPYWRARGLGELPIPPTIRVHDDLKHADGVSCPAMLAAVSRWPGRDLLGLHRTYLTSDLRRKANVSRPKMTLGVIQGCAIRLAPAAPHLLLAEGIETTAAAMIASGLPGWAAISAGNLAEVVLPEETRHVIIAADNDLAGHDSAVRAAERFTIQGRVVRIVYPPNDLNDFCDALMAEDCRESAD